MLKKLFVLLMTGIMAFSCVSCSDCMGNNEGNGNNNFGTQYEDYNYNTGVNLNGATYMLVENGVAKYSILLSGSASEEVVKSVAEFNNYVFEVSGVYLPTVKEGEGALPDKFISFGDTEAKKQAKIDTSDIKEDGFVIKTIDGNVYFAANLDRGVQYAAYSFLERFLGVRWLTAQETYIPKAKTITMRECDIKEEPIFGMRQWMGGNYTDKEYYAHMRYYTGEERWCQDVPTGHNSTDSAGKPGIGYVNKSDIAPDGDGETLGEKHPEYFSDYTNNRATTYELCFTNGIDENGKLKNEQSVASLMIEKMKQFLTADAEKQQIQYLMVGHVDDRSAFCRCDTCIERREKYLDSGIHIIFLNAVSDAVNEWLTETQGRKVMFITFAYQYTATPPVEKKDDGTYSPLSPLVVCNDDIIIRIAPIDADYTYSFADDRQLESQLFLMNGWSAVSKHFMIWDYVTNYVEYYWYFPNMNYIKENIVKYQEMGVMYCMFQSSYTQKGIWHDDMRSYIASKLMWNIHWDIEYLMNEYIELYYGVAADTVKAVVDSFENFYAEQRKNEELNVVLFEGTGGYVNNESNQNPKAWVNSLVRIIENGMKKIENNSEISETEKAGVIYKLEEVLLTPMRMILRNYNSYYTDGKIDYAIKYFDIVDAHGIKYLGETDVRSVATRKRECGLS